MKLHFNDLSPEEKFDYVQDLWDLNLMMSSKELAFFYENVQQR